MKKFTLIIIIFLILIISFYLVYPKKNNEILETKKDKSNFLSIMVEKETGTGEYNEGESFPSEGYFLNKKLSKCVNGSKIKYEEGNIYITGNKTDRCYAYFDKDELGSICRGENLAECFIKNYRKDNSLIYHDGKCDYEGEENCELEAGDLSYRYAGSNDVVHNYVCLDTKENGSCDDTNLYRIIGLFKNEEDQYEIKLIKANIATSVELGTNGAYYENNKYSWNNSNGNSSTNMWQYSNLNNINLNTNFYNNLIKNNFVKNNIIKHSWITGGLQHSYTYNAKIAFDSEVGSGDGKTKVGQNSCYTNNDPNNRKNCEEQDIIFAAYISLIYISDYGYAAYPMAWSKNLESGYNDSQIKTNNWLSIEFGEWSVCRYEGSSTASWAISVGGNIFETYISGATYIRPVFYLASRTILKSGNGTITQPFRLN